MITPYLFLIVDNFLYFKDTYEKTLNNYYCVFINFLKKKKKTN